MLVTDSLTVVLVSKEGGLSTGVIVMLTSLSTILLTWITSTLTERTKAMRAARLDRAKLLFPHSLQVYRDLARQLSKTAVGLSARSIEGGKPFLSMYNSYKDLMKWQQESVILSSESLFFLSDRIHHELAGLLKITGEDFDNLRNVAPKDIDKETRKKGVVRASELTKKSKRLIEEIREHMNESFSNKEHPSRSKPKIPQSKKRE